MIVIDASAVIALLFRHSSSREAAAAIRSSGSAHAPHLLDAEIAQVVRRFVVLKSVDESAGRDALSHLAEMSVTRHPHRPLLQRVYRLRNNLTAYDALYVALAEVLDAPLLTRDKGIASAAGHSAEIILV